MESGLKQTETKAATTTSNNAVPAKPQKEELKDFIWQTPDGAFPNWTPLPQSSADEEFPRGFHRPTDVLKGFNLPAPDLSTTTPAGGGLVLTDPNGTVIGSVKVPPPGDPFWTDNSPQGLRRRADLIEGASRLYEERTKREEEAAAAAAAQAAYSAEAQQPPLSDGEGKALADLLDQADGTKPAGTAPNSASDVPAPKDADGKPLPGPSVKPL